MNLVRLFIYFPIPCFYSGETGTYWIFCWQVKKIGNTTKKIERINDTNMQLANIQNFIKQSFINNVLAHNNNYKVP